jgi:nucleotide-binding universal stress UspA family protein
MVAKEQAKSALRDFVTGLELRGDVVLRRRTDHGDPYLTIQRTAQLSGYDLIVLAGPKPGAGDADSVTRRLLGTLPGPVLLVPAHAKARLRSDQDRALKLGRVLVPLALAGAGFEALRYAQSLAGLDHASVEVLLTPDVSLQQLARFRGPAALGGVDEHESARDSAQAVPERVEASGLDLVVAAGPRAALGAQPDDQRAMRLALAQHCPSLCVPELSL